MGVIKKTKKGSSRNWEAGGGEAGGGEAGGDEGGEAMGSGAEEELDDELHDDDDNDDDEEDETFSCPFLPPLPVFRCDNSLRSVLPATALGAEHAYIRHTLLVKTHAY